MTNTDYTWLSKKLVALGYTDDKTLTAVQELCYTLDSQDLDKETAKTVSDLFASVIGERIFIDPSEEQEATWSNYRVGETKVGDTIRVKNDAYEDWVGDKHNGKVGKIVAIRGGRVRVQYLGRDDGAGHPHLPEALEVLDKH